MAGDPWSVVSVQPAPASNGDPWAVMEKKAVQAAPPSAPAPAGPSGLADRSKFPFDQPGVTYGSVLPFAKNENTGEISLAWPEMIRAPVRGAVTGGERLMGLHPEQIGQGATPDQVGAVSLAATPLRFGNGQAAAALAKVTPAEAKAAVKVADRLKQDAAAGGKHPSEVYDEVLAARAAKTPLAVADVGDKNVQKLAGSAARAPGPGSTFAENSYKDRLQGAGGRLTGAVDTFIADGPTMRQSVESLSAAQKQNAAPLYEKAFQPGSVAPLEKQFETTFSETSGAVEKARRDLAAANQQLTMAAAEESRAGNNVYMANHALRAKREAQAAVEAAQQNVAAAEQRHFAALDQLREAQEAVANGDRGGIWSPYIGRLLQNQEMKKGVSAGIRIQRNEADAANAPFNPRDYAIVGVDENGEPVVGKVPNMRLLDAAKKGLDAMLEEYRNPITGKLDLDETGRSIEMLRKSLVSELDRLNPDYAAARAAWAGPAQSKGALKAGRAIFNRHPEDIAKFYNDLSPSDQQFYKMGVAEALKDAVAKDGVTAPEIRRLGRNSFDSMMKERIRPLFGTKEEYDKFLDAVTGERTILEKRGQYLRGSQTAERVSDDATNDAEVAVHGLRAAGHAITGNGVHALASFIQMRRQLGLRSDPKVNEAIARLLFDPNIDFTAGPGLAMLQHLVGAPRLEPVTNIIARLQKGTVPLAVATGASGAAAQQ